MKVVGYYNSFARQDVLESLFLTPLTHINYAFLIPKENGDVYFYDEEDVKRVVEFAHNKGIKVFVSVGGYCDHDKVLSSVFEEISRDVKRLAHFINSVCEVVIRFGLDGVDLDWEYPTKEFVDAFELMTACFSQLLHYLRKGFTIAVHRAVKGEPKEDRIVAITDRVIYSVDWMNIMTYDSAEELNHSSIERCKKCFDYWHEIRKVPKDKFLIGIAFYARPSKKPYSDLIEESYRNAFRDYIGMDSYNGLYTVREKTYFGELNCGGVLIWAINYDTTGQYSLLSAVNSALSRYYLQSKNC